MFSIVNKNRLQYRHFFSFSNEYFDQRVLAEELQEGLTLTDQPRNIPIEEDTTEVLVELRNIKPGWVVHNDQDHKRVSIVIVVILVVKDNV